MLGKVLQMPPSRTSMLSTMGISTKTPRACATAPTANGKIAAPVIPNAAEKPMLPTCRCGGRTFVAATTEAGKRGPRKKPTNATATAETKKLGTSQKMRCAAAARAM